MIDLFDTSFHIFLYEKKRSYPWYKKNFSMNINKYLSSMIYDDIYNRISDNDTEFSQ